MIPIWNKKCLASSFHEILNGSNTVVLHRAAKAAIPKKWKFHQIPEKYMYQTGWWCQSINEFSKQERPLNSASVCKLYHKPKLRGVWWRMAASPQGRQNLGRISFGENALKVQTTHGVGLAKVELAVGGWGVGGGEEGGRLHGATGGSCVTVMMHWELGILVHILDLVTTIVLFLQRIGKEFFIHFHAWISRA